MFAEFLDELNDYDRRGLVVAFQELDQQRRAIEASSPGSSTSPPDTIFTASIPTHPSAGG
jgi:hypothetical protein